MKVNLDKELDQYFKSSFEDFEQEPSSATWEHIKQELDKKPAKNSFILWSAAASILLILGVGFGLYFNDSSGIKLKSNKLAPIVAIETPSIVLDKKANSSDLKIEKNVALKKQVLAKVDLISARESISTNTNEIENSIPIEYLSPKIAVLEEDKFETIKPIKALSEEWSEQINQKTIGSPEIKLAMVKAIDIDQNASKGNNKSRKISISSF